jgi:hypothetical protein
MKILYGNLTNTCGKKRGCSFVNLPYDSKFGIILGGVYESKYDSTQILSLAYISLDKKLEKERPLEKMVA